MTWQRGKPDALLHHHSDQASQYASEQFQRLMADSGIVRSMSRSGKDVFDYMERFYNATRRHSTIGCSALLSSSARGISLTSGWNLTLGALF